MYDPEKVKKANVETPYKFDHITEKDLVLSIIEAKIDKKDYSELYYPNKVFFVFYEREGKQYFANV